MSKRTDFFSLEKLLITPSPSQKERQRKLMTSCLLCPRQNAFEYDKETVTRNIRRAIHSKLHLKLQAYQF
jgi:hypothetical protein